MAIAFDSYNLLYTPGNGTNLSSSFTNTNGNFLVVVVWCGLGSGGSIPTFTTVTYNGVAMTQLYTNTSTLWRGSVYYLASPATGANTLAISHSGGSTNSYTYAHCATYSGVHGTPIDASPAGSTYSAVTSKAMTVTTVADNCWTIMGLLPYVNGSAISAGASTTLRGQGWGAILDSNAAKTPAGAVTLNSSFASDTGHSYAFSIKPAGGAPTFTPRVSFIM